ncbi:hypothetical protein [Texcoconibacillus texcoconensis]|uniref:Uncharacterized protein n=1 Tax=Texcoconibacillus texcoconensis TaxID=1095777 RepID=A0A840QM75_9BACI|nr:hypothetical protein [Texcoconibacillus texcoconensis]MBB5172453.1 hypothetical protein [Texcoconibacillus texcoconensis]
MGEAKTPFYLCDLIFHEDFTDCEDPVTWYVLMINRLRDFAATASMNQERVLIYDAKGLVYDTATPYSDEDRDDDELSIVNYNNPKVIDAYDPWTAIASLIKERFIHIWGKYPTFSEENKTHGCKNCIFNTQKKGEPFCIAWDYKNAQREWEKPCFWLTNGEKMKAHHYVYSDEVMRDMSHRVTYRSVSLRTDKYKGLEK